MFYLFIESILGYVNFKFNKITIITVMIRPKVPSHRAPCHREHCCGMSN